MFLFLLVGKVVETQVGDVKFQVDSREGRQFIAAGAVPSAAV